jgi:uncharacterized protein YdeI (YjbR/CyaY-like superfamily)
LVEDQQGEGGTSHRERADGAGHLRAIENAKRNGRWQNAYHSAKGSTIPEDFLVAKSRKAKTRARRIEQFIAMLERHEKIHP